MENPYNVNSPFTIRLDLLKLAQSIESDRIWSERNRLEMDYMAKREQAEARNWDTIPAYPELPTITYKDVIRVAEELNKFVSNKG